MMGDRRRIDVIINARSGAPGKEAAAAQVRERLAGSGVDVRIELVRTPAALPDAAARAAAGDADVVVAGGGDGTIATVAGCLLDTPKLLGVLPLGTFNYFARRIGVPADLAGAADILVGGVPRRMSVGEVNGRVFLNNSSIGLYPAVLKQRETAYRRVGRSQAAAYLSAAAVLFQARGLLSLQLTADGTPLVRRTPLLFVAINPHQIETFGIPGDECLDAGRLATYVTRPMGAGQLWRLALRGVFRALHGAEELELVCARELDVTLRRKRVRVALDGEIARLRGPLRYRLRRDALAVLTAPDAGNLDADDRAPV